MIVMLKAFCILIAVFGPLLAAHLSEPKRRLRRIRRENEANDKALARNDAVALTRLLSERVDRLPDDNDNPE